MSGTQLRLSGRITGPSYTGTRGWDHYGSRGKVLWQQMQTPLDGVSQFKDFASLWMQFDDMEEHGGWARIPTVT